MLRPSIADSCYSLSLHGVSRHADKSKNLLIKQLLKDSKKTTGFVLF